MALIKIETSSGPYTAGDEFTYDITIANQGDVTADTYTLTDTLPAGTSLKPGQPWTDNGDGTATLTETTPLPAGQTRNHPITLILDDDTLGTYLNNAEISADDGDDTDSTPDTNPTDPTIDRTNPTDINIDTQTGDEDDSDIAVIVVNPPTTTTTARATTTTAAGATTTTAAATTTSAAPSSTTSTSAPAGTTSPRRRPVRLRHQPVSRPPAPPQAQQRRARPPLPQRRARQQGRRRRPAPPQLQRRPQQRLPRSAASVIWFGWTTTETGSRTTASVESAV